MEEDNTRVEEDRNKTEQNEDVLGEHSGKLSSVDERDLAMRNVQRVEVSKKRRRSCPYRAGGTRIRRDS